MWGSSHYPRAEREGPGSVLSLWQRSRPCWRKSLHNGICWKFPLQVLGSLSMGMSLQRQLHNESPWGGCGRERPADHHMQ